MKNIPHDILWSFLLDLKVFVKIHLQEIEFLTIIFRDNKFTIFLNEQPQFTSGDHVISISVKQDLKFQQKSTVFQIDDSYLLRLVRNEWMDSKTLEFLLLYLPFCLLTLKSFQLKRSITLLHFAQTLDGKIAANNGHSKWIGNQQNLVHAHRLRALFDGILIGSNTLKVDKPRLSVRLVKGQDPVKIVVGNFKCEFDSLLENHGKVLFITSQETHYSKGIETIFIPKLANLIEPALILRELYIRGIHSLFIEGGAFTGSSFLSANSIDFLQLFISPKILGSGIACFSLKEITSIKDSIKFSSQSYNPMGDGILFSGDVKY